MPIATLACDTGISIRTLQRWNRRYRDDGVAGLDPRPRVDKGTRRTDARTVAFIERLALTRPRPALATLHRLTVADANRRDASPPSYATVRDIVRALDPALVTLALEGPASYRDRHELVLRRRADRPNQTWQADHTELDILIIGADGKPDRPWLTTVMDDYSRAICGYTVFTGAPSAATTALALRQAIWRKTDAAWAMCGLPDIPHVDHGSDFTSNHLERTAIGLHIRIIHSIVGLPQGRGKIERFFGTINTELLATLPGHLGPGNRTPTPALDLPALDRAIGAFITTYSGRPHSELGLSPRDAWVADGWLPRMPRSLEDLDTLLLTVPKNRVVQRDGIHFQGQRYLASPSLPSSGTRSPSVTTLGTSPRSVSMTATRSSAWPSTKTTRTCDSVFATSNPPGAPAAANSAKPSTSASRPQRSGSNPTAPITAASKPATHLRRRRVITRWGPRGDGDAHHYALANRSRTVFYTPEVLPRPKEMMRDIDHWHSRVDICVWEHQLATGKVHGPHIGSGPVYVELLIIDEAERLTPVALEMLRDRHDRTHLALILIGMPGIDQRFRHYPQLYSRLGFSHHYRALGRDELLFVLQRHWKHLGRTLDPDDFTDAQAIAAIERITRGNFRLLERLFPQINRVLKINDLETITDDVIEAAASILVIGS